MSSLFNPANSLTGSVSSVGSVQSSHNYQGASVSSYRGDSPNGTGSSGPSRQSPGADDLFQPAPAAFTRQPEPYRPDPRFQVPPPAAAYGQILVNDAFQGRVSASELLYSQRQIRDLVSIHNPGPNLSESSLRILAQLEVDRAKADGYFQTNPQARSFVLAQYNAMPKIPLDAASAASALQSGPTAASPVYGWDPKNPGNV